MIDTSLYVTLSRQTALTRELEVVANNLANLSSTGFKSERLLFDQVLKDAGASDDTSFVIDRATYTDHRPGAIVDTNGQLDLAIRSDGFFAVETPSGEQYTRDGRLVVSPAGELAALDGSPILDDQYSPIPIPPEARVIDIAVDGTVNIDGDEVARIGVFSFNQRAVLDRAEAGRFVSNERPERTLFANLQQRAIEASNVEPIKEITKLIELSREYERSASMGSKIHEQKKDAVKKLGSA